jgi:hypothetical protein
MTAALHGPRNDGWTKAMNTLLRNPTISPGQRTLYMIIQSYTRETWRWCTEQHATLAADYGCTERQLQRLLDDMIDGGLLLARPYGHGRAKAYLPIAGLTKAEIAQVGPPPARRSYPTQMSGKRQLDQDRYPTFSSSLPDISVAANPTFLSPLKEDSGRPVKTDIRSTPEGASPAPAPARETDRSMLSPDGPPRPVPKPRSLPIEPSPDPPPPPPPPPPRRPPAARGQRPRTEPPETLEPTTAQRDWALANGFTEATLADEIERCLDRHRIKNLDSGNWHSSLRIWLKNELSYAAEDGREPGVHARRTARPKTPATGHHEAPRFRKDGSRIYTGSRGAEMPPDMQKLIDRSSKY